MSHSKLILIAHAMPEIRARFAAALADARHECVTAASADAAREAVREPGRPVSLAVVDLGLGPAPAALVGALRAAAVRPLPVLAFAGTVPSGGEIPALSAAGVSGYINEHAATPQILPALAPHLFPASFDRRASTRAALGIPMSYRAGHTIAAALTLNLGKGGLAIRTMSPLPAGTAVTLRFRLPSGTTDLEVAGQVVWSNRQVGMGIQFDGLTREAQAAIDTFVERNT